MTALSIFSLSPLPSTSSSTLRHRQNPNRSPSPPRASFSFRSSPENEPTATEKFVENNSIADFVRFNKPSSSSSSSSSDDELQTAIVSYRKKFPYSLLKPFLRVDLVSTIHIADKEYFKALQKELETYDCVLYEMVASRESLENCRNTGSKKRLKSPCSRGFNVLGFIQRQMARILTLDFQLDCLDYQAENWHHADLNFETFKLLQTERGESLFTFARDMALQSTKAMMQPMIPKNLDPWRSDLMRASRVLPVPLVGLLIIVILCSDVEIRYQSILS